MKHGYGQYCGLARALDVVGDKWSLLIVRELLARGRCRYVDLKRGLPGIASNLLADRLRELEHAGVLTRSDEPPPVATHLYSLTGRGAALAPAIEQLGRWAGPLMAAPAETDRFQSHWMVVPLRFSLGDSNPEGDRTVVGLEVGDEPLTLVLERGALEVRTGRAENAALTVAGPPQHVMRLLKRELGRGEAEAAGVTLSGDDTVLARIAPRPHHGR